MPSAPLVRCYDAAYSAKRGTYHLLLEDVSPTHRVIDNGFPPTQDQAQRIVDALAEFHAFWWDHPRLGRDIGELPTEYSIRRLIGHAECYLTRMLDRLEDRLSSEGEQAYRLAFSKHGSLLIQRLTRGKHLTLVHGDAHARNFMLPRGANSGPTYIIDWYVPHWVWRCFLGVSDLAYLMVRFWDPARRRSLERPLLERYHERLQQRGVKGYSADGMLWDYRLSAILSLYIVVEEAVRSEPSRWYPQLCHALAAFEELDCSALLRSSCQSNT